MKMFAIKLTAFPILINRVILLKSENIMKTTPKPLHKNQAAKSKKQTGKGIKIRAVC